MNFHFSNLTNIDRVNVSNDVAGGEDKEDIRDADFDI